MSRSGSSIVVSLVQPLVGLAEVGVEGERFHGTVRVKVAVGEGLVELQEVGLTSGEEWWEGLSAGSGPSPHWSEHH